MVVHKQILLPLRPRFGIVAEQNVVEPQTEQLLRSQKRHACLLRSAIAFSLIALYARRYEIRGSALPTLGAREDVIEREVLGVAMLSAVLATITITNVNPCTLHCGLASIATDVNIMSKPNHGRNGEDGRRRMENIVAVFLFNKYRTAKP